MTQDDAIVVLGCATGGGFVESGLAAAEGELGGAAARRVARAASAFHEGRAPLVLACGGRRWNGIAEATAMADGLVRAGVPRAAVRVELVSLSTSENARFAAERLLPHARRIALVTCEWHEPRAASAFARAGFVVTQVPAVSPPRGGLMTAYLRARELASSVFEALRRA